MSNTLLPWNLEDGGGPFLLDYSFVTICVVGGLTLAFLISTLHKLDDAMVQVSNRIGATGPADKERFAEYMSYIRQWMPTGTRFYLKPAFWYYFETLGGAFLGGLFGAYWSIYTENLWWGRWQFTAGAIYYISFCALSAYIVGAIIFAAMGSVKAVRRYCKEFITGERVLALNPDKVGGLRPLGQFSLELDISFALPSFVIFSYLIQGVSIGNPVVVTTLLLYTLILVVVFFIPLSAAHDSMLVAKERAYNQVNDIFKEVNSTMAVKGKKFNFARIKGLKDVYFLYDRVSKMAVWPLNIGLVLKFAVTSSFPIVGSLIVAYLLQFIPH
jgi:hypothetical protein